MNKYNIDIKSMDDLKKIPILTKAIVLKNYKKMRNNKIPTMFLQKRITGGTTGAKLFFYSNNNAGCIDAAYHMYLYKIIGYKDSEVIIGTSAEILSKRLISKNIFWKKKSKSNVWGNYVFSVLYLTQDTARIYIDKLVELNPAILRGLPSFFYRLSQYINENNILIPCSIKVIILTSEVCSVFHRKEIEKAFNTKVIFEYGHREISVFAYTTLDTYVYKSASYYSYVEVLNEDGTDTEEGFIGRIVVTGLINKGMPFIRYDTEDYALVHKRRGGIVWFKEIHGRKSDYIINKQNHNFYLTTILPLLLYKNNILAHVLKWQIIQKVKGKIIFKYVVNHGSSIDEEMIKQLFEKYFKIEAIVEKVNEIKLTHSGKHVFIKQEIQLDVD